MQKAFVVLKSISKLLSTVPEETTNPGSSQVIKSPNQRLLGSSKKSGEQEVSQSSSLIKVRSLKPYPHIKRTGEIYYRVSPPLTFGTHQYFPKKL